MRLNLLLATRLAIQNLRHHRLVSAATVLGVAIGMTVVGAVLIVDNNTARTPAQREQVAQQAARWQNRHRTAPVADPPFGSTLPRPDTYRIAFVRQAELAKQHTSVFPIQERQRAVSPEAPPSRRGEEDYQAMRLAVRLASLLAFAIGTIIVFYTMRFSVASRSRALSLLLCLGEFRSNISLSLLVEALGLGLAGTVLGVLLTLPMARYLLLRGISTTGQAPLRGFAIPWGELGIMAVISIVIALLGIMGPVRSLYRMHVATVLQPRFLAEDMHAGDVTARSFLWVIPPLLAATYLVIRPFLVSWLSVVQFFLFEAVFVAGLTILTLWWVQPLLRLALRMFEALLRPFFSLEILLTGRRMRLTSQKIAFSIVGITLVFSLLTSLHDITRALKAEISRWASEALLPYAYFQRDVPGAFDAAALQARLRQEGVYFFRLSEKMPGEFPIRLISAEDVNPYREAQGRRPLHPETVILSKTLAARFGVAPGDVVEIRSQGEVHRFQIIEIADDTGFVAEDGLYVDLKSYALFSDKNPLFANNLEQTLGLYGAARLVDARPASATSAHWRTALSPSYRFLGHGASLGAWQVREIDRDFLIFDFIMLMTVVLAAIGVTNTLLIQVHARDREFSVLRTVGISRWQITKLLVIEGVIIGLVSAFLALVLGHVLGAISVAFLDRFTLFEYIFVFSARASLWIAGLAVCTCCGAALYPAVVAARTSSAESLHYE